MKKNRTLSALKKNRTLIFLAAALFLPGSPVAPVQSKEGKAPSRATPKKKDKAPSRTPPKKLSGRALIQKALNLSEIEDMKGKATLELIPKGGRRRKRVLWLYTKEEKSSGKRKMYLRFVSPADVRNTAMLIKEYPNRSDDIYMYLPSLRRINRITGSGKGGSFMNSDFTYADMTRLKLHEWTYKRLPDKKHKGKACYVIACRAKNKKVQRETGYWKMIRWLDKKTLATLRVDYLDNRKKVFKRLLTKKIKMFGKLPFATDMLMTNLQTEHKSRMRFRELETNTGLSDRIFSKRTLLRRR